MVEGIPKGAAQSWQLEYRGPTMVDDQFDFGFASDWMRKDLSLCISEARRNGANLPVAALVDPFYAEVQKMVVNRWDTSALLARLASSRFSLQRTACATLGRCRPDGRGNCEPNPLERRRAGAWLRCRAGRAASSTGDRLG